MGLGARVFAGLALASAAFAAEPKIVIHRDHMPWGLWAPVDVLLDRGEYVIGYDTLQKGPQWTGYRLTPADLEGTAERQNDFREDTLLAERWRATLADYRRSGYDRGHSAPAADFVRSDFAMSNTFVLSNMVPQTPRLNRQMWADLERQVRTHVRKGDTAYVVTGYLYGDLAIGDGVGVPEYCFKVVGFLHNGHVTLEAWVCDNVKSPTCTPMTVEALEEWIEWDLFMELDDD